MAGRRRNTRASGGVASKPGVTASGTIGGRFRAMQRGVVARGGNSGEKRRTVEKRCYFTVSSRNEAPGAALFARSKTIQGKAKAERGSHAMWISLFTFACGAAVCLSVAAIVMQPARRQTLRG